MRIHKLLAGSLVSFFALSLIIVPHTLGAAPELISADIVEFTDVSEKYPYVKAIEYLQSEGIVEGYEDGTFKAEANINRAEFLKIVMEASDFEPGGTNCYPDVQDQWFAKYVCAATKAGLVQGYDDGTFKPEQNINFVEASKIVVNTLKLQQGAQGENWFDSYVHTLEDKEVIPFDVNSFDGDLTRGQMAEMIWRIHAARTYKPAKTYNEVANGTELTNDLMSFSSCQELHDYLYDNTREPIYYQGYEPPAVPDGAIAVSRSFAEKGGGAGVVAEYSETNVQVKGVDEADIIKNDGEYIYSINGATVKIAKAYPPAEMSEVSTIDLSEMNVYPNELYLGEDQLVVIGEQYYYDYFDDFTEKNVDPDFFYQGGTAKVLIFDVSNRSNPKLQRELAFEGDYASSRKIGDTIYFVAKQENNMWPWNDPDNWKEEDLVPLYADNGTLDKLVNCEDILYMGQAIDEANYLIVAAIPLNPLNDISKQVVLGSSIDIYASTENLYVAQEKYDWWGWYSETDDKEETYIHKFELSPNRASYKGMGVVPGSVLNQFSMDEYEGNFRIVTTLGDVWNEEHLSTNNLYILDEDLNTIGKIEGLAPGERIYSARFAGDRGYVVTFKKVDPLFVMGLEDPQNPKVLGELKIPGFSDYLHPYDENHIIGFGLDTAAASTEEIISSGIDFAWYQGVKVAMFDVTDVENPVELHREIIGDRGTSSPLNYNHKALLYSKQKGNNGGALMAFPIAVAEISEELKNDPNTEANTYGDIVFQGAYVYDVDVENGFNLRGEITHYEKEDFTDVGYGWYGPKDIERILYIGDYLYTVSQHSIFANEIDQPENEVSRVEFSQPDA